MFLKLFTGGTIEPTHPLVDIFSDEYSLRNFYLELSFLFQLLGYFQYYHLNFNNINYQLLDLDRWILALNFLKIDLHLLQFLLNDYRFNFPLFKKLTLHIHGLAQLILNF